MSKTIFYNVLEKISKFDKQVQYFYYSQYLFFIQNKRMNEHVGIFQLKLCVFTREYSSNTLYLTSKIVYTMPEINQIIV